MKKYQYVTKQIKGLICSLLPRKKRPIKTKKTNFVQTLIKLKTEMYLTNLITIKLS